MPKKSNKNNVGEFKKDLNFAGVLFQEGNFLYSDSDGIIISEEKLI
jgi:regulator of ribonuclease activity A